jgi:hypothetical protein
MILPLVPHIVNSFSPSEIAAPACLAQPDGLIPSLRRTEGSAARIKAAICD